VIKFSKSCQKVVKKLSKNSETGRIGGEVEEGGEEVEGDL
jgi:hypothetical protein